MKKLLLILIFSNLPLFSSEHDRIFTKDTCHRTYYEGSRLNSTLLQRHPECLYSRFEVLDKSIGKYIAHIAYSPKECFINYLCVDEEYQRKGIGTELARKAIADMRNNYGCEDVSLESSWDARGFWKRRGAERQNFSDYYVFRDFSSK